MKRIILSFVCLLLVSVYAFADQTLNGRQPREWAQSTSENNFLQAGKQDYSDNTTVFTNLAVTGNQATGNAGYITMSAVDAQGNVIQYYLWMDATLPQANTTGVFGSTGVLRYASFPLLTSNPTVYASFPYGDWRGYIKTTQNFASGYTVVAR